MNKGDQIKAMLLQGISNRVIRKELNAAASTVSYHANKLGLNKKPRPVYDWKSIQSDIDLGMTVRELSAKHGFAKASYSKARKRGALTARVFTGQMSLDELCDFLRGKEAKPHHRKYIRRQMIAEGVPYACAECGLSEWRGEKLSLEVDHIDGDRTHNSRGNFRLLCPNCHSITPTWRGRNARCKTTRLERRQAVRQEPLKLPCAGSNPAAPAILEAA